MTMKVAITNLSNWTNEVVTVKSFRDRKVIDLWPGESIEIGLDKNQDLSEAVVLETKVQEGSEPHRDEEGQQIYPRVETVWE